MEKTSHTEVVKEIILDQLGCDESAVTLEADLRALGADSLDGIELIMAFEDAYDIEIDDAEAEKIRTVGDIVKYLERTLDQPSA